MDENTDKRNMPHKRKDACVMSSIEVTQINPDRILNLLQMLIRMRSCGPQWDELDIVRYIESLFDSYPVRKTVVQHGNNRASLIVDIEGRNHDGRRIAFVGHIDTMTPYNPGNWTYGPFSGHFVDGKVYGIGSSNAKSGVAAMLAAALSMLEVDEKPENDLMLCFTADSDGDGLGAEMLLQGGFMSNVSECVFCDQTGSEICVAQKGTIWLDIDVRGHSRHIMESTMAVNALQGIVTFAQELGAKFTKITKHHILGKCSVHLTQIATHDNAIWMIPGHVTGRLDARITPSVSIEEACGIIEKTQKNTEAALQGLHIDIKILNKRTAVGMATDAPLVCSFMSLCEKEGRKPKIVGQAFYTDASTMIPNLGVPFVIIGPGEKIFNDREDENVALSEVVFVSKVYRDYMIGGGK